MLSSYAKSKKKSIDKKSNVAFAHLIAGGGPGTCAMFLLDYYFLFVSMRHKANEKREKNMKEATSLSVDRSR